MRKIVTLLVLSLLAVLALAAGVNAAAVDGTEVLADVTYENLEDRASTVTVTKTFVVKNSAAAGTPDESVALALINPAKAGLTATFVRPTFTLAAGASETVTMTLTVPVTFDSGLITAASIEVTTTVGTAAPTKTSVPLKFNVKSMIEIDEVEVQIGEEDDTVRDGQDIDIEATPEDSVKLLFKVSNLFDKDFDDGDFENVELNVVIDDTNFGDDVDEDADDFDLDASDDLDDVEVEFTIPDDAEDGTYDMVVTVEAEQDSGAIHTATFTVSLEVSLEDDDVRIVSISPTPLSLRCNRDATVSMLIKNFGSDDQDDVSIQVDGSELNINEDITGIELDQLGDSKDDTRREFEISLSDDVDADTYDVDVRVYINGDDLMDEESFRVTVEDCAASTPTTPSTPTTTTPTTVVVQPTPVVTTPTTTPTTPTGASISDIFDTTETPFTQTPLFLVLLVAGNVLVLGLIVFIIVKIAVR